MDNQPTGVAAVIAATHRWITQPFLQPMDLFHWFLIVGVVIISAMLWGMILRSFQE
jgi:hypothetical protein